MKPRWLIFALVLPTDDLIFVQYTIPTVVMSRQCDQTPKALAILQGQAPTRKRARQPDPTEQFRARTAIAQRAGLMGGIDDSGLLPGLHDPGPFGLRAPYPVQNASLPEFLVAWPQDGPFVMSKWRESIQKVCRTYGLTRSFEQEDMHELAKIAGFIGNPATGSRGTAELSKDQWNFFGTWFLGYLHILKDCKELWMSSDVKIICGFAVTRERANQLLANQPQGTFILRPSVHVEATIVISVVQNSQIRHLSLDRQQLELRSLESWIGTLDDIHFLLDIDRGSLVHKSALFRAPPLIPANPGFPGALPQAGFGLGGILPSMPQGQVDLQQILEISRRGSTPMSPPLSQSPPFRMHGPAAFEGSEWPSNHFPEAWHDHLISQQSLHGDARFRQQH